MTFIAILAANGSLAMLTYGIVNTRSRTLIIEDVRTSWSLSATISRKRALLNGSVQLIVITIGTSEDTLWQTLNQFRWLIRKFVSEPHNGDYRPRILWVVLKLLP